MIYFYQVEVIVILCTYLAGVPLQTFQTECVRARQELGLLEVFQADSALRQGRHSFTSKSRFQIYNIQRMNKIL